MKTMKKRISILCFALCFVMLLASCNQLTMSGADANNTPEDVSSKEMIEESVNVDEESKTDISMTEESKDEEGKPNKELPEEPDYVVEMTEEMFNEFTSFSGRNFTLAELIAASYEEFGRPSEWLINYKRNYAAYGNINGYTFCYVAPGIDGRFLTPSTGDYITKDYKYHFRDSTVGNKSRVNLYLYKDHTFVTLEDACEQGLIDPAKAYELIQNKDFRGSDKEPICVFAEKLTEEEANWYKELRKNAEEMYK